MIRIPETLSVSMPVQLFAQGSSLASRNQLEFTIELDGIQSTDSTNPAVSPQHLLAQISGVCSQSPLVDTVVAAESAPASGYFDMAPAADSSAVRASFPGASNPATGLFPVGAHYFSGGAILV